MKKLKHSKDEEDEYDSYSSSSSSIPLWKKTLSPSFRFRWAVFLSFRGEDTRHNFIDRLYKQLLDNNIRTFQDRVNLDRGEEILPSLLTAIEDSAASIVVISQNYAASCWCLEELATIVDYGRLLLPVFYDVDPSHVRQLKGSFQEAFRCHQRRFGIDSDKVLRWKKAMEKAGGISGWDSRTLEETQLIQSLVKDILTKMSSSTSSATINPSGIDSLVQQVLKLLDDKSNGVQLVGFYGVGGTGKTKVALAVCSRIVALKKKFRIGAQFENHTFNPDTRETRRKSKGLTSLRNKIIYNLFPDTPSSVVEVARGIIMIKEKIHDKRVLFIIVDNDDDDDDDDDDNEDGNDSNGNGNEGNGNGNDGIMQFDALASHEDWYHEGRRIVVKTKECIVLSSHLVTKHYEVKELDSNESLEVFSYRAFGRRTPINTFKQALSRVSENSSYHERMSKL